MRVSDELCTAEFARQCSNSLDASKQVRKANCERMASALNIMANPPVQLWFVPDIRRVAPCEACVLALPCCHERGGRSQNGERAQGQCAQLYESDSKSC